MKIPAFPALQFGTGQAGGLQYSGAEELVNPMKQQCPECNVKLTRYQWSQLWWVSSGMSGRLVQPCSACGALLRLSAMRIFTFVGALGLLATSLALSVNHSETLLIVALVFSVLVFVGVVTTRVETVLRIAQGQQT
jgi:hypothetical protein